MVEDIEEFKPELHDLRFRDAQILQQRHVEVIGARSVEEALGDCAGHLRHVVQTTEEGLPDLAAEPWRRGMVPRHQDPAAEPSLGYSRIRCILSFIENKRLAWRF